MQKKNVHRLILEAAAIIAAVAIVYYFLQKHAPNILDLIRNGKVSNIDEYLESHGKEGKILVILLQIAETVSIVLPATPVYLAAGVLFGKLGGVLVCWGTNLILNILIFQTARKLNIGKGHSFELEKQGHINELFQHATRMDRVVLVMCFLPVVPNGMIPYLSAQTNVKTGGFTRALAIGSLPSIAAYVCCGDVLVSDSYKFIIPVIILLVIAACVIFVFRKQLLSAGKRWLMLFLGENEVDPACM